MKLSTKLAIVALAAGAGYYFVHDRSRPSENAAEQSGEPNGTTPGEISKNEPAENAQAESKKSFFEKIFGSKTAIDETKYGVNEQNRRAREKQGKDADIARIEDPKTEFSLFGASLLRLSAQHDAKARSLALELLNSPDRRFKDLAIHALGYFDEPEVNKELLALSADKDLATRQSAINALALNPHLESPRKKIIEEYITREKQSNSVAFNNSPDQMKLFSSLYQMTMNPKEKTGLYVDVLKNLHSNANPVLKRMAAQTILQMNPKPQDRAAATGILKNIAGSAAKIK